MPVQATLTLNTKAYNPRGTSGGVSTWALVGDASFGGAVSKVTESVRDFTNFVRSRFVISVPKAATEASACACPGGILGIGKVEVTADVPPSFTQAEKQDLCDRAQALIANAIFDSALVSSEGSW